MQRKSDVGARSGARKVRRGLRGFSLVEVLVVVALLGVLAAIAIPYMGARRTKVYNVAAESDLKNFKIQMESQYADQKAYPES